MNDQAGINQQAGSVALVGAGPGGADLITVRGARAIGDADVIVADRLADPELLRYASPTAEIIDVGKCKGNGPTQAAINAILIDRAGNGLRVVRLKGGDPFMFGRGGEEIDALIEAGIAWEIVPGVTSALAAPALAGISVTERGMAASVTVISGHRADAAAAYRWGALAQATDTLVVLMAASTSADIACGLIAAGRSPDLAVAACHRAGHPGAQTAVMTLRELAEQGCPFPSPTVLVIGEVAAHQRVSTESQARSQALNVGNTGPRSATRSMVSGSLPAAATRSAPILS
ncbi:MAG TPA: uroporphyrinogen-III C-methyltransferase [Ilumatobacter sp.]|nr:uroporphyrinogen-III C-methyltransferase [Ilumatobacter sp.]